MEAVWRFGSGLAKALEIGMAEMSKRAQFLREKDCLVAGVQIAGFAAIASAILPMSWTARFALAGTSLAYAKFLGGDAGVTKVFFKYFPEALLLTRSCLKPAPQQNEKNGSWMGSGIRVRWSQFFDSGLAQGISDWVDEEGIKSVWDFGCGQDRYSKFLVEHNGILASGLDGNPATVALSRGSAQVQDLTVPFQGGKRQCAMSFEAGDKIPEDKMDAFLDNLTDCAEEWALLSWAEEGQKGPCHLNLQPKEAIIKRMSARGWVPDKKATERLSKTASPIYYWLKNLTVFKKQPGLHID